MTLDAHHDFPLAQRPATPHWCENFALMASDAENGVSVFFNLGTWYGDTSVWREVFAVALPDGRIAVARNYGRNTSGNVVSAALARFEVVDPESKFRLTYDGPVWCRTSQQLIEHGMGTGASQRLQLDLTFDAITPVWDMAGDGGDRTSLSGALHTEQLGRCKGTLRYDQFDLAITSATSVRDHTRGVRSGTQYRNHCWIQCDFPGNRAFHVYAMRLHNMPGVAMAHATVIQDGRHHHATIRQIDFLECNEDARQGQTIILDSKLGEMVIEVREVLSSIPVSFVSPWDLQPGFVPGTLHSSLFDGSARMEWEGKPGVGWYERGFSHLPLE